MEESRIQMESTEKKEGDLTRIEQIPVLVQKAAPEENKSNSYNELNENLEKTHFLNKQLDQIEQLNSNSPPEENKSNSYNESNENSEKTLILKRKLKIKKEDLTRIESTILFDRQSDHTEQHNTNSPPEENNSNSLNQSNENSEKTPLMRRTPDYIEQHNSNNTFEENKSNFQNESNENSEDFFSKFLKSCRRMEGISKGQFDIVIKFYHTDESIFYAFKYAIQKDNQSALQRNEETEREDKIMTKIKNINELKGNDLLLNYKGLFRDENRIEILVMQSWEINLDQILKERKKSDTYYTIENVLFIMMDLIEQLKVLEEYGIANRDIKPDNIIIFKSKGNNTFYRYLIADFGGGYYQKMDKSKKPLVMTQGYAAPEVVEIDRTKIITNYDPFKADVYSLAATIVEIVKSIPNFEKENQEICEILTEMLNNDPNERPCFKDIYTFLKGLPKEKFVCPINEEKFIKSYRENLNNTSNLKKYFKKKFEEFEQYLLIHHLMRAKEILKTCQKILKKNPDCPHYKDYEYKIIFGKGNLKQNRGEWKESLKYHERALKLYIELNENKQKDPQILNELAILHKLIAEDYFEMNCYKQAEENFIKCKNYYKKDKKTNSIQIQTVIRKLLSICCYTDFKWSKFNLFLEELFQLFEDLKDEYDLIKMMKKMNGAINLLGIKDKGILIILFTQAKEKAKKLKSFIQEKEFNKENPLEIDVDQQTGVCRRNGLILFFLGEYEEFEKTYLHLKEVLIKFYGKTHYLVVDVTIRLASFCWRFKKKSQEAINYFGEAFNFVDELKQNKQTFNHFNKKLSGDLYFEFAEFQNYREKRNIEKANKYYEEAKVIFAENSEKVQIIKDSQDLLRWGDNGKIDEKTKFHNQIREICRLFA